LGVFVYNKDRTQNYDPGRTSYTPQKNVMLVSGRREVETKKSLLKYEIKDDMH